MLKNSSLSLRHLRVLTASVVVALSIGNVYASPEPRSDAVAQFLAERGIVEAVASREEPQASGFVQQVRSRASDLVVTSMNFLGVPYRRGGNSEEAGFDCSGFTRRIFEMSLGKVLPRRADEQAKDADLIAVKRDDLRPGDLVFFNTLRRTFSHVGIYAGDGKFIHAPRAGSSVRVDDIGSSYWSKRFTGARRATEAGEVSPSVSIESLAMRPSAQ